MGLPRHFSKPCGWGEANEAAHVGGKGGKMRTGVIAHAHGCVETYGGRVRNK